MTAAAHSTKPVQDQQNTHYNSTLRHYTGNKNVEKPHLKLGLFKNY